MKKIIVVLVLLSTSIMSSQSKVENKERNTMFALVVVQDAKLAIMRDNSGNSPFTLDLTVKMEWRSYSSKIGYFSLIPNIEYAKLAGGDYLAYGLWGGYTFDEWLEIPTYGALNKKYLDLDIMPYIGISSIKRAWVDTFHSNSLENMGYGLVLGLEATIKLGNNMGLVFDFKLVDRKDLKYKYSNFNEIVSPNFGIGFKNEF